MIHGPETGFPNDPTRERDADNYDTPIIRCSECRGFGKLGTDEMIEHIASGERLHEYCKEAFIKSLCDGDEINPKFRFV